MLDTNLRIGYCYDDDLRRQANSAGRNYWHCYVEEIVGRLGVTAESIGRAALADPEALCRFSALLVGDLDADQVPAGAAGALREWVEAGGILIGFMSAGLEQVFGCRPRTRIPRPGDDFCQSASFALGDHPVAAGVRSTLCPEQRLIILGDALALEAADTEEVARLFNLCGADTGRAAITARALGQGTAFYFGFNVPQTLWGIQQGRPITGDYDGDGYLRFSDARTIGANDPCVAYADEILLLLANMLAVRPHPCVAPIPPLDGRPADLLLFWGGDDEATPGIQVPASDWMRSRGLPYHINLMPLNGRFAVTPEEFAHIEANGHECSLHYNFMDGFSHPCGFTRAVVAAQARLYRDTFGKDPVCTVNHWCRWTGWHEPARWMAAEGSKADNSRIHRGSPPTNPVNTFGFSFGTAYPTWFYSDYQDGNRRLDFLAEPIIAYEMGYRQGERDFAGLHTILEMAAHRHLTLNLFHHPVYIVRDQACRDAIDEGLRFVDERGWHAVHAGPDELWRWWSARSQARLTDARSGEGGTSCLAECAYPGGFTVRVPCGTRTLARALSDGTPAASLVRHEFGQAWVEVALPPGTHRLEVAWE